LLGINAPLEIPISSIAVVEEVSFSPPEKSTLFSVDNFAYFSHT
jgi:hypothetical protein